MTACILLYTASDMNFKLDKHATDENSTAPQGWGTPSQIFQLYMDIMT